MELKDIAAIYDCPHSTAPDEGAGFALIRTPNIGKGRLLLDNVHRVSKEVYDRRNKRAIPQEGDIIFAREAPAGNAALITKGQEVCLGQRTVLIKPNHNVCDSEFLVYYLLAPEQQIKLLGFSHGATVEHVNISELSKLPLTLPQLKEQRRIASILSAYDNLIENNTRRIRLLEQMAENLYKEWFVRFRFPGHEKVEFVNGLPRGWKEEKLENILSLKDNVRIPLSSLERSEMQKKYPYYGAASILDYVDDYLFEGVYLLLGEDGSVVDENGYPYIQYVWGKFWVNNHAHVIEKNGIFSVEYLYCMFKKMNILSIVTGVAQPKISQGRLFNKKVIKPSDAIISLFDKMIQPIFAEIRQLTEEIKNLTRQRDLLLPRLMSGRLEVKE